MRTEDRIARLKAEMDDLRDKTDGYFHAGKPKYDRLFGRDSLISAWQRLEHEPHVAVGTLRKLASLQGVKHDPISEEAPGKILHEWAPEPVSWVGWDFPYYGTADATPLFIMLAHWTQHRLGNDELVDELWPNVLAGCEWMESVIDTDAFNLLSYFSTNPTGLKHQGWKDGWALGPTSPTALIEIQGYGYSAFLHAAEWAERFDTRIAIRWRNRAERLRARTEELFWLSEEDTYALAVQADGSVYSSVTSNIGHLLFTGLIPEEKISCVVERLFAPDMWTEYGMRTLSVDDPSFELEAYHKGTVWPHDNWIVSEGLRALGYTKEREMIRDALVSVDEQLGKMPEFYAVTKSGDVQELEYAQFPQAWSSGALLNLLDSSRYPETAIHILPPL